MSRVIFNKVAQPSAPASGKVSVFTDTPDGRVKSLDSTGVLGQLTDSRLFNYMRNGGFWFAQRQTPGTATTYSSTAGRAISADGWGITNENASATYQRTDTVSAPETGLQSEYYGNFLKITSTGKVLVSQVLDSKNTLAMRTRTVRVQCWMKQLVGSGPVVNIALVQLNSAGTVDTIPATFVSAVGANGVDPTLGANLAYIAPKSGVTPDNATATANAVSCTLSSVWQRFGAVFDVPNNCKNLIVMIYGNNQFVATNGFALSQVSLTDGYELQDWTPQQYESELTRVQRYYQKTFDTDTGPVQNVGINKGEVVGIAGKAGAVATSGIIAWRYPTNLRVAPTTTTLYNPAAANALMRNITGAADMGTTAAFTSSAEATGAIATGVAATAVGDQVSIHFSVDAEL